MKKQATKKDQDKDDNKTGKTILGVGLGLVTGYLLWDNWGSITAYFKGSPKPATSATSTATSTPKPATSTTKPTTSTTTSTPKPATTTTTAKTKYAVAIKNTILYKDWARIYLVLDLFNNKLLSVPTGFICGAVRDYDNEMVKLQQKINGVWYTHYVHRDDVKFIEHGDTTTPFKQWTTGMATEYNNARIQY